MSYAVIVSEWHVNAEGLWENRHGWFVHRQQGTHALAGSKIFVGFRPDPDGRGDKIRPDGDLGRDLVWACGWGLVWAPDLETLMQRVDRVSGHYERLAAVAPAHLDEFLASVRAESEGQLLLGLWPESA